MRNSLEVSVYIFAKIVLAISVFLSLFDIVKFCKTGEVRWYNLAVVVIILSVKFMAFFISYLIGKFRKE